MDSFARKGEGGSRMEDGEGGEGKIEETGRIEVDDNETN